MQNSWPTAGRLTCFQKQPGPAAALDGTGMAWSFQSEKPLCRKPQHSGSRVNPDNTQLLSASHLSPSWMQQLASQFITGHQALWHLHLSLFYQLHLCLEPEVSTAFPADPDSLSCCPRLPPGLTRHSHLWKTPACFSLTAFQGSTVSLKIQDIFPKAWDFLTTQCLEVLSLKLPSGSFSHEFQKQCYKCFLYSTPLLC